MGVSHTQISVSGYLSCAPQDVEMLLEKLPAHAALSRAEAGCLHFEVTQSQDDPCRFDLNERFKNRTAFEAHQERTKSSDWGRSTQHLTRSFVVTEATS